MFQVAHFRLTTTQQEPSKKTPPQTARTTVTLQQHRPQQQHVSTVVVAPGITTMMEPPPSIIIDQNLLHELLKRFPEVSHELVIHIIQQKGNRREDCMMALVRLVRESGDLYSPETPGGVTNGPRGRSNSTSSRGSISGACPDQSPTSNSPYTIHPSGNSGMVPFHHSSSEPHNAHMPNNDPYVSPGPKTAPTQTGNFQPFANPHPSGVPMADPSRSYWMPGAVAPYPQQGPHSWRASPQTTHNHQATGQYPASHLDQFGNPQQPSTPSRPGGFEKEFPPGRWDYSPESPSRKPPAHGGPPSSHQHNTHVPSPQHHQQASVGTTTPRHPRQSWDKTPTSPSTVFQAPPGQQRTPDSGSTYISSYHKYITPEHQQFRSPSSIDIELGRGDSQPFSMLSGGPAAQLQTSRTPPAQSSESWLIDNRVVKNPPDYVPHTDMHGPPSLHSAMLTQELVGSPDFHNILDGRQIRSGSLGGEDIAYTESLLRHQKERLDKLKRDIRTLSELRDELKTQVAHKDQHVLQAQRKRVVNSPSISMSDLQKVREENRSLQIDSHLLTLEFDRVTKGQAVIGSDPNEDFYARIPRGQLTPIISTNTPTTTTTTVTTAQPSSHPPAPPTLVSGQDHLHHLPHHPPPLLPHQHQPHRDLHNVNETEEDEENWSCSACTFLNHPEINQCEMCNMPRVGPRR